MIHVVIADDDEVMRDLVERIVTLLGWTFDTAVNGIQAQEMVDRLVPDLVIADVGMSGMDGIDLLHAIKGNSRLSQIPVVMMSSMNRESEAREGGAAAFIPKPFTMEVMVQILAQLAPANTKDSPSPQ
ncbi:MAG: response regulator [Dehalococcoidia bacterium]